MENETPPIEERGGDYLLRLGGDARRYRVTVPRGMLDDELGDDAPDDECRSWIRGHLSEILGTVMAREAGGIVSPPWGRLVVEELD